MSFGIRSSSSPSLSSWDFSFPASFSVSSKKVGACGRKIFQTGSGVNRKELCRSLGRLSAITATSVAARIAVFLSLSCMVPEKMKMNIMLGKVQEALPLELDSTSELLPVFDGTTRLYISYSCPYAQRVWIARNYKGLQDKIKLVPMDLKNRPTWYKEKVYAANKVPALEHNNKVIGESLDLIKYIDTHFKGPSLAPDGPEKQAFAEELLSYTDSFYKAVTHTYKGEGNDADAAFDYVEKALSKFDEGPFFLGGFSLVDVAYVPFIERFQLISLDVMNVDITFQRPKLAVWIQEMNKIEAYTQTRQDPRELVERYKKRFLAS